MDLEAGTKQVADKSRKIEDFKRVKPKKGKRKAGTYSGEQVQLAETMRNRGYAG